MTPDDLYEHVITDLRRNDGPDALARPEWGVLGHTVRADIALLSPRFGLHLVELKTDRDTLNRLPMQADWYSRVADSCTLVVAQRHFEKARAIVPDWWALWPVREEHGQIVSGTGRDGARTGSTNHDVNPIFLARLLHVEEARQALRENGGTKGTSKLGHMALCERLRQRLDLPALQKLVHQALRIRPASMGGFGPCEVRLPSAMAQPDLFGSVA